MADKAGYISSSKGRPGRGVGMWRHDGDVGAEHHVKIILV